MRTNVGLIVVLLSVTASGLRGSEITDIQTIYRDLERVRVERDVAGSLQLLDSLDQNELWDFGGGIGPTDSTSLQMLILRVCDKLLLATDSERKNISTTLPNSSRWRTLVAVRLNEDDRILDLLNSPNAAERCLILLKLSGHRVSNPKIVKKLQEIAGGDSFAIFLRLPRVIKAGSPPPSSESEVVDITTPLREYAKGILRDSDINSGLETSTSIEVGLARLDEDYKVSERRAAIIEAIHGLPVASRLLIRDIVKKRTAENQPASTDVFWRDIAVGLP